MSPSEAAPVARWLNGLGLHVAVAGYPVAPDRHPRSFEFVSTQLHALKSTASPLPNDPNRVGVMGFSAGGHLAALLCTLADLKPDLAVLSYPVVSFVSDAHEGSVENLLGPEPTQRMREELSPELHVGRAHPPTFLWHTAADPTVPVSNSLRYAEALWRQGVDVELHVFNEGRHGLSLAAGDEDRTLPAAQWTALCARWLSAHGWVAA